MAPRKVIDLTGRVVSGPSGKGTKSEHAATFLETLDGNHRYLLRRKDGPAFDDPEVTRLAGKKVVCSGFLIGTTLLAEDIRTATRD